MREQLEQFCQENGFKGKGPLSVALVITELVKKKHLPLNPDDYITKGEGQVLGLGGDAVQAILKRHGITRLLAREGGRTSRGSIGKMRSYIAFLNQQYAAGVRIDWDEVEGFWIEKVNSFFAGAPFKLTIDPSQGLRAIVRNLVQQAVQRQKEVPGTMFLGTMMQHLVGAKLRVILGETVSHHSANQNDQQNGRTGDFDLGDVSIHVTSSPNEYLLKKCADNLIADLRPIIVTVGKGVTTAEVLAENIGIGDRVDIVDFDQFIAMNIHEHSHFAKSGRRTRIEALIECYNEIIEEVETDPSLKIVIAQGK